MACPCGPEATHEPWLAANNGTGRMMWFAARRVHGHPQGMPHEYDERADGHIRRFGSYEAAQRRADELNANRDNAKRPDTEGRGASHG